MNIANTLKIIFSSKNLLKSSSYNIHLLFLTLFPCSRQLKTEKLCRVEIRDEIKVNLCQYSLTRLTRGIPLIFVAFKKIANFEISSERIEIKVLTYLNMISVI